MTCRCPEGPILTFLPAQSARVLTFYSSSVAQMWVRSMTLAMEAQITHLAPLEGTDGIEGLVEGGDVAKPVSYW